VNVGENITLYNLLLEKNNSNFELDFYYVCKKELEYYIPIRFNKVVVNEVDIECMNGDTDTWDGKILVESEFNTLTNQIQLPTYFGFVVKQ